MEFLENMLYQVEPNNTLPEDLLAFSTNLSPELIIQAYTLGLFPWHQDERFFYWFSPDPRMIVYPEKVKVSKSMRNVLNQNKFEITFNKAFDKVMRKCAETKRPRQDDTWITEEFIDAYSALHELNMAHSIEAWNGKGELVGGLYGIIINNVFFGESMFSNESNASKVCFIKCAQKLVADGITLIDCQAPNPHLKTLGAEEISRDDFSAVLKKALAK